MFGIGSTEILLIVVVALLVLGPKNLPKAARTLGKAMGEFRKVSTDFQRTINAEIALEEREQKKKDEAPKRPAESPSAASQTVAAAPESPAATEAPSGASASSDAAAAPSKDAA